MAALFIQKTIERILMKTILICNQKGGVGKTLIADELAFALEKDEINYTFFDLDQQGGSLHENHEDDNSQVQVIDTPGALQKDLKKWMEAADYIVIPTMMSNRDMQPLINTLEIYNSIKDKSPALVVFNRWKKTNIAKDFTTWFDAAYPDISTAILCDATAFNDAGARAISIEKYKASSNGAKQIREIYSIIKHELKLKEGYR